MRLGVLASHGGSVLQAVIDAIEAGKLGVEVVLVISNNSGSQALQRAKRHDLAIMHLSRLTHPDPADLDVAMTNAFTSVGAQWLLLAGYMKKLGPTTLATFHNRILNTHPALLPKFGGQGFYGRKVHEAVIAAGERESGATVHLVEGDYDTGPIVSQTRVVVRASDAPEDLEARVKDAERALIVATLTELAETSEAAHC